LSLKQIELSQAKSIVTHQVKDTVNELKRRINANKNSIEKNAKQLLSLKKQGLSQVKSVVSHQTKDTVNELKRKINTNKNNISKKCRLSLNNHTIKLKNTSNNISSKVQTKIAKYRIDLYGEKTDISNKFKTYILAYKTNLDKYRQQVRLINPASVFSRGYALVYKDGKIITDPKTIKPNEIIQTRLKNIYIESKVISKNKKNE
jgi:exodeoxyribonuclease VII large subunit